MVYKQVRKTLKSKKWSKFRERILKRDNYLCQESLRFGERVQAEMVHHIYPVSEYPELEFVKWNCISLTNQKHNTFHDRKNDSIVGNGKIWQKRFKRQFQKFYQEKNFIPPT
ncbi:endonuclease [Streptococcus cuniculi]|uniref:Endonuclease n=1 Tax=Streptococcus cuniculi TaxID=1432788 RepID=A0A1Q8E657_9STRE|nr:HNH endonuclease [Streptococcus cuniculi]OLF47295.1 endonuclease [Streptococcus cuniculi]